MKTRWRFGDSPEDGDAWLKNPSTLFVYVDYEATGATGQVEWRRLMVVTKSWLEGHLAAVRHGSTGPLWVGLPSMIVLPDATGRDLLNAVESVVGAAGLEMYSDALLHD